MTHHIHHCQVYYEDTDLSGMVYHANYLKFFERAREHFLGPDELVRLLQEEGIGFVVYKAALSYREGARLGDKLEIRSRVELISAFRVIFHQNAHRTDSDRPMVEGRVELVCVNQKQKLVPIPSGVIDSVTALQESS